MDVGLLLKKHSASRYWKVTIGLKGWDNEYVFIVKDPRDHADAEARAMKMMKKLNLLGVYKNDWYCKKTSGFDSNTYFCD